MSRYIDAKKIIETINSEDLGGALGTVVDCLKIYAKYMIETAPTADVVEVIRCKDCVHCADDWNGNQPMFTCEIGMCHESVEPSGYCFCGERRKDG